MSRTRDNESTLTADRITGTANQIDVTNTAGNITLSSPQDIATTSDVRFNGVQLGSAEYSVPLTYYGQTEYTATIAGPWTEQQSMTINAIRVGKLIHVWSRDTITGTFSTPSTATTVAGILPSTFWPARTVRAFCFTLNDGSNYLGHMDCNTNGTFTWRGSAPSPGNFTAGDCRIFSWHATYAVY